MQLFVDLGVQAVVRVLFRLILLVVVFLLCCVQMCYALLIALQLTINCIFVSSCLPCFFAFFSYLKEQ